MNQKINIKYFLILVLTIGFMGCKNSTRSKIIGTWDSSYSNDEISVSGTTTFYEGKNQRFSEQMTLFPKGSRASCEISISGKFTISENNIISFKVFKMNVYNCNSSYLESKLRDGARKMKNHTSSVKILSLDSGTMITEDLDDYERITYIKR